MHSSISANRSNNQFHHSITVPECFFPGRHIITIYDHVNPIAHDNGDNFHVSFDGQDYETFLKIYELGGDKMWDLYGNAILRKTRDYANDERGRNNEHTLQPSTNGNYEQQPLASQSPPLSSIRQNCPTYKSESVENHFTENFFNSHPSNPFYVPSFAHVDTDNPFGEVGKDNPPPSSIKNNDLPIFPTKQQERKSDARRSLQENIDHNEGIHLEFPSVPTFGLGCCSVTPDKDYPPPSSIKNNDLPIFPTKQQERRSDARRNLQDNIDQNEGIHLEFPSVPTSKLGCCSVTPSIPMINQTKNANVDVDYFANGGWIGTMESTPIISHPPTIIEQSNDFHQPNNTHGSIAKSSFPGPTFSSTASVDWLTHETTYYGASSPPTFEMLRKELEPVGSVV